ncbi:MAG: MFS transporter [candidate division KSB1 bacterium]|nr:MFS transporter [candidate division KSB1 bacterium]MDZ7341529.1 MFS transporter [candidate division KSB1 bacterium]
MTQTLIEKPHHSAEFRLRRFLNWFPMGLTYAFLYMARYNLTVSKNALGDLMSKSDFGLIFGIGTFTYAFAFLLNGPLTDRIGGKKAILLGAFGAATMNLFMGLTLYLLLAQQVKLNLLLVFSICYLLNMYFQSFGAVAIVKVNASWFHVRERGMFGGIFGVLISLGLYFAFDWSEAVVRLTKAHLDAKLNVVESLLRQLIGASNATVDQTWWIFFIPAIILYLFFILEIFLLKDRPSDAGLQDFDTLDASSGEENRKFELKEILTRILTNRVIIIVAIIEMCTGVLRQGIMHWYFIFAKEELHLGPGHFMQAHWGLILMLAGASGGMLAGFLSDKIFGSRRGPVAALLYGTMILCTTVMAFVLYQNPVYLAIIVTTISFCVIGTHGMLSGTATMDFGGRRAAATAVGLIDGAVYLGTAIQSISLGFLTEKNWHFWPVFLIPFSIAGFLLAINIWHAFPKGKKQSGH